MNGTKTASEQREGMEPEEPIQGMVLTAITRIEVVVLACEVCLNERFLQGIGDGLLQYALLLCIVG